MRRWMLPMVVGLLVLTIPVSLGTVRADGSNCSAAGDTGLTAAVIAQAGQTITGAVDGTGCNVGIFVGPGVTGVRIIGATVTGADDHGIFAQDTSNLLILRSTISGNGFHPHTCDIPGISPCIAEDKAVELAGVSNSVIAQSNVSDNGFGGLGIADDSPGIDPGAFNPGTASPAVGNVITGNFLAGNLNDCAIVVAAYGFNVGASNNVVTHNTVRGDGPPFRRGFADGQIVVATDGPNTSVVNTVIANNVITGSELPGIVVHANVAGDVIANTMIVHNAISNSGYYPPFFATVNTPNATATGIALVAEGPPVNGATPVLTNTVLSADTDAGDSIGIWLCYSTGTLIAHFSTTAPTVMTTCAAGGS
jgi:Right handed beta helix region